MVKNLPAIQETRVRPRVVQFPGEGNNPAPHYSILRASLRAQKVNNLPAMQDTWVSP